MAVIQKLVLHNFRSYKDAVFEFGQITDIIPKKGSRPNAIGKTNVLRALKIVLFHDEFSEHSITWGCSECFIEAHMADGHIIKRLWAKSKQKTVLTYPDGTKKEFDGVKDATSYVKAAIGLNKIALDTASSEEDFNYIPAGAPIVFLNDRQDALLRKMSSLIGSSKLEEVTIQLGKDIRSLELEKTLIQKEIKSQESLVSKKVYIVETIADLTSKIRFLDNKINNKKDKLEKLIKFQKTLFSDLDKVKVLVNDLKKELKLIEDKFKVYSFLSERHSKLNYHVNEFKSNIDQKEKLELLLVKTVQELDELLANTKVCPTCNRPI